MSGSSADKKMILNARPEVMVCLVLVIATLAVYWQVRNHFFLNFDDDLYVTGNYHVRAGLSLAGVKWALTETEAANWHPLTRLSHMLDVQLFGMNAGAHHMTSMFFHLANTVLLFFVFKRMTGCVWQSGFVAALFTLHPLHVESVAWVSERKDVLSTFFWLLTMGGYVLYIERPGKIRFLITLLFFAFGLMAKPMLVTLPFVLLLMDYWPLDRFGGKRIQTGIVDVSNRSDNPHPTSLVAQSVTEGQRMPMLRLVVEKLPFFALSAVTCWLTIHAQQGKGAVGSLERFPIAVRVTNALVSYVKYIGKTIWPENLAAYYPHPGIASGWWVVGAGLLLVVVSILAIRTIRQLPWLIVGWLWYLGTLVPVIGFLQVGTQAMADRYTYVPLIGLFIIMAWGFPELAAGWRSKEKLLALAGTFLLVTLMVSSWFQARHWKDSITLFQHAIKATTNNYLAHEKLGVALTARGKPDAAIRHFKEALRIKPDNEGVHLNLANALLSKGRIHECIRYYQKVLRDHPGYAILHHNLGVVLAREGKISSAIVHLRKAFRIKPDYAQAHNSLGVALVYQGLTKEAMAHFREALRIKPNYSLAQTNLNKTLRAQGNTRDMKVKLPDRL
jgi:tetratricopeptide (TPR) repeat protein